MVNTTSALIYPALVAFEGSNVSVGRGTDRPFQQFGAPWLAADSVAALLNDRRLSGVRFDAIRFTPQSPTDNKFGGRAIPGVRIVIEDRERVNVGRIGASVLWAIAQVSGDSLRLNNASFDLRFGSPDAREKLLADGDPDEVIDRMLPALVGFQQATRQYLLYR